MGTQRTEQSVLFEGVFDKPVVVTFDAEHQSSDGGVILFRQLDAGLKLTKEMGKHLVDDRDPTRVEHSYLDLFRQRVYGIALGYSDCNDAQRIAADPCVRMACGRSPIGDDDLGSQPTLSRFENSQPARAVIAMTRHLEQHVIKRLAKRHRKAKLVTIDLDPSADPTHGQQQFSYFHGHYDMWCYLPMLGFLSIDDEPEQFLFYSRLRPGNSRCYRGVIPLLRRVVPLLRKRFTKARIRVRLDGGFAHPMVFDVLDELKVEYVVGMPGNSALNALAEPWMQIVRHRSTTSGQTETSFGEEIAYKAGSWSRPRRVIIKAEVVCHPGRELRDNTRYVVTNLRHTPENVYAIYRGRGDSENRIKEMKELDMDRTSCSRFVPNQLRLLMTATAYVLYQEMRRRLRHTEAGCAQVGRLRLMLMKIGARVVESVRRVVLHFPAAHPWRDLWVAAARLVAVHSP